MLYRVCGRSGSGKTEYMLSLLGDIISSGGDAVVIVPEQQSLDYERLVFTRFGDRANLRCEILNFERLPNRTYREYGGLSASSLDKAGRDMLMATALENVAEDLEVYKNVASDVDFVKNAAGQVALLKQNGISTEMLENAIEALPRSFAGKIGDIAKIAKEYEKLSSQFGGDSADSLTTYAEKLEKMPFFEEKTVIIDSFYSFTCQEHRIIDAIARQARDVYISFLYDPEDRTGTFDETEGSFLRVSRVVKTKDIILPVNHRASSSALAFAEEHIWKSTTDTADAGDSLHFVACRSLFEECEAAAAEVTRLIGQGMRMRDIAIIARTSSQYDGVIDAVLTKHGITAFMSSKDELAEKPLPVFLLSAVEACADGFSLPVMKKYIKSGYTGLPPQKSRLLIRYASTWDIRGKAWIKNEPWLANPDGYIEEATERQKRELADVNSAKNVVCEQLSALYDALCAKNATFSDCASALYTHLVSCGADKATVRKAEYCRSIGDEDGAQKLTQLWGLVISVLEQLSMVCGDSKATPERLLFMLRLAFSEYKVGTIPLFSDAVTVGDASMVRSGNVRAAILLGVNDGVFPASAENSGLLCDDELAALEQHGINMGDTSKKRRAQEKLYFYVAATSPTEKLTVIYNDARPSRPSIAALHLMRLFPDAKRTSFGDSFFDISFSPEAAAENILAMPEDIVARLASMGLDMTGRAEASPLCDTNAIISKSTASGLYLSPSRLEKYTYCAFSYFGRYILKLTQNKKAAFDYPEIGTFVHRILELFMASRVKNGGFVPPSDDEIKTEVDRLTDEYILSVCKGKGDRRFRYICTRLKNTLFLLIRNISDELSGSGFVPVAFERKLTGDETVVYSPGGMRVNVRGTVDRVDEYKRGGEIYIRVVDYKTGSTVFSKKALKEGLGLQMLMYLFSLCRKENKLPAGVLYVPASLAPGKESTPDEAADIDKYVKKRFKRSGIILADTEIADAMEKGVCGIYLPAKLKKDETFDYRSSVATVEQLGKLKLSVENYIGKLADELTGGNMNVSPLKLDDSHNACRFCDMKTVCRLAGDNSICREHSENQIEMGDDNA